MAESQDLRSPKIQTESFNILIYIPLHTEVSDRLWVSRIPRKMRK
jgi:hypothetical protein